MKILHVAQPTTEGVARCVADLVVRQKARGWDVSVASPVAGDLRRWVIEAGATHLDWEAGRNPGRSTRRETGALGRLVERADPDIAHLHSSKAGLAGRLAIRRRLPTVFQPHAWSFAAVTGPTRAAALLWERIGARWADVIVCVSRSELEEGERRSIKANWGLAPNGVDLELWPPPHESTRDRARLHLALGGGALVVCVGRLSKQKGQDVLLAAWPRVLEALPDARLVLIGEGPEVESLRAHAARGVSFAGLRRDVPEWIRAADVVALPSRWEGMALTMIEGMAAGRSVVATDVAGAREALDRGAGAVVPVEDPGALAAALLERLRDPELAAREGTEGRRRVEELYNLEMVEHNIMRAYEAALSRHRRPKPRPR